MLYTHLIAVWFFLEFSSDGLAILKWHFLIVTPAQKQIWQHISNTNYSSEGGKRNLYQSTLRHSKGMGTPRNHAVIARSPQIHPAWVNCLATHTQLVSIATIPRDTHLGYQVWRYTWKTSLLIFLGTGCMLANPSQYHYPNPKYLLVIYFIYVNYSVSFSLGLNIDYIE